MIRPVYYAKLKSISIAARVAKRAGQNEISDKLVDKAWTIFDNQMDKEFEKAAAR